MEIDAHPVPADDFADIESRPDAVRFKFDDYVSNPQPPGGTPVNLADVASFSSSLGNTTTTFCSGDAQERAQRQAIEPAMAIFRQVRGVMIVQGTTNHISNVLCKGGRFFRFTGI